ncbi:hypothetical protein [Kordia jejudonensis]|uniref:hypothetical protein n=1 Tax=Kordia jejudonensis TaxID=1348245 RepID=UPI000629C0B3|nr:hypothetical protein [Kordia jejudonensis]
MIRGNNIKKILAVGTQLFVIICCAAPSVSPKEAQIADVNENSVIHHFPVALDAAVRELNNVNDSENFRSYYTEELLSKN